MMKLEEIRTAIEACSGRIRRFVMGIRRRKKHIETFVHMRVFEDSSWSVQSDKASGESASDAVAATYKKRLDPCPCGILLVWSPANVPQQDSSLID